MKKILVVLTAALLCLTVVLTGCGKSASTKMTVVKIGVNGENHKLWDNLKTRLVKDNIDLQVVVFSDYVQPNLALASGDIDLNSFQTHVYFDDFIKKHNLKLAAIGDTILAPMGIYSQKIKSLSSLKDGATVAVPNDASNEGRALVLLQSAGLIKLKDGSGLLPTTKDIVENSKNLKIKELVANQIPHSLPDVDIAAINNNVALDAKLSPKNDAIYIEDVSKDTAKPYINIFAAREKDKDKDAYKKVVKAYQSEATKKDIQDIYKGALVPAFK